MQLKKMMEIDEMDKIDEIDEMCEYCKFNGTYTNGLHTRTAGIHEQLACTNSWHTRTVGIHEQPAWHCITFESLWMQELLRR